MASILSYVLPIFSSIITPNWSIQRNVEYGKSPGQIADLYLHRKGSNRPAIILIHGGGWAAGDKSSNEGKAKKYALAGFNVIAINYTLATSNPATHWPAQLNDVRKAFQWVKSNAFHWGIDPNRIAVGGASAGGHLALWAGTEAKAVLNMYGPCDLTDPKMAKVMEPLDVVGKQTYDQNPQLYIDASPLFKIDSSYPPVFIAHPIDDEIVPYNQAEILVKRLTIYKVRHKLVSFVGGHDSNKVPPLTRLWVELQGLWFMLDNT